MKYFSRMHLKSFLLTIFFLCPMVAAVEPSLGHGFEFSVEHDETTATVLVDGDLFAKYQTLSGHQPIIWPIIGPSGKSMTRSYPMTELGENEMDDHRHHRSLWFAHGIVNQSDLWLEPRMNDQSIIRHKNFLEVKADNNSALVSTSNEWIGAKGGKLCEDERHFRFGASPSSRWIDATIILKATEGDVTFGDTKEGTFALRVPGTMKCDANLGGRIINSRGQREGEAWGQPAEWVDFYGPVEGDAPPPIVEPSIKL